MCRKLKSQIKLYDIDARYILSDILLLTFSCREDVHESITRLRKELNYIVVS